jgi:hypothetical protein
MEAALVHLVKVTQVVQAQGLAQAVEVEQAQ